MIITMSREGIQSLLGRIARNGRGQLDNFIDRTSGVLRNTAILAVPTTTFRGTLQFGAEAFAVLAQTAIVFTGATLADHFGLDDKGVRSLLLGVLNGGLSIAAGFGRIATAHTRTNVWVTDFAIVKAGAIELQTP